jgi:hypothetical protein
VNRCLPSVSRNKKKENKIKKNEKKKNEGKVTSIAYAILDNF